MNTIDTHSPPAPFPEAQAKTTDVTAEVQRLVEAQNAVIHKEHAADRARIDNLERRMEALENHDAFLHGRLAK